MSYSRPAITRVSRCPTPLVSRPGRLSCNTGVAAPTRRSPLPDFYIGAHAAVASYRLLTRDTDRYRTYFPTVVLIAPG